MQVPASATFPAAFTPLAGYNCSGQDIEVQRLNTGDYYVNFTGSPVTLAVGNASRAEESAVPVIGNVSILIRTFGSFEILITNPAGERGPPVRPDHAVTADMESRLSSWAR